jgi:hypothetical protein
VTYMSSPSHSPWSILSIPPNLIAGQTSARLVAQ